MSMRKPPLMGGREIDLYRLHQVVVSMGGYHVITQEKRWVEVGQQLKLKEASHSAYALRQHYSKWLLQFEVLQGQHGGQHQDSHSKLPTSGVTGGDEATGVHKATPLLTAGDADFKLFALDPDKVGQGATDLRLYLDTDETYMNKDSWLKFIDKTDDICIDGGGQQGTGDGAVVPPEVPELPATLQTRTVLHEELKARVLGKAGGAAGSTTALTAAPRSTTMSAHGMGGCACWEGIERRRAARCDPR